MREAKQENRCRAEEWSTDSVYNVSTNEQAELRKMEKAGGKEEGQLVREARQTQREERETYYSHRLITIYSPTLTGTRLGHNTHT